MYDKLLEVAIGGVVAAAGAYAAYRLDKKLREETGMGIFGNLAEWYGGASAKVRAWIAQNPNRTVRRILGKLIEVSDNLAARMIEIHVDTKNEVVPVTRIAMKPEAYQQMIEEDRRKFENGEMVDLSRQLLPMVQGA